MVTKHHNSKLLKRFGMLREPQHERKILNDIITPPFVTSINSVQALSTVEGLRQCFKIFDSGLWSAVKLYE